jgi:hypothetical protein
LGRFGIAATISLLGDMIAVKSLNSDMGAARARLRLIALIEDTRVIRRILAHLGLPTAVPATRPSRAPPLPFDGLAESAADDIPIP